MVSKNAYKKFIKKMSYLMHWVNLSLKILVLNCHSTTLKKFIKKIIKNLLTQKKIAMKP